MTRVVLYLRKSPANNGRDPSLSIEAQEAACRAEAARLGWEVASVHVDHLSGKLPLAERPGLLSALADLKRGDALLVARRDRAGRDSLGVALLEREIAKRGSRLHSASGEANEVTGPQGEFIRTVLDAVSQMERGLTALRTRSALRAKRARNEPAGAIPFGYDHVGYAKDSQGHKKGGRLVTNASQQRTLTLIRTLRAAGKSYEAIADELNARGEWTAAGKKWWPSSCRSVLRTSQASGVAGGC